MDTEQNSEVECPTCKGLGKVHLNGDGDKSTVLVRIGDQMNENVASEANNLKSLTEMDTVIGCSTDLLPEKSIINDPKEIINSIKIRLKNTNLEEHKRAIFDAVQVARDHHNLLKPHLNLINKKILHFLNSQQVLNVRIACQSAGELFRTMRCTDRPIFDNIVVGLLYRTANKNQNVRIDANWALDKMVISVPPSCAVRSIANCSHHKNPAIKIAQLRLLHCVTVMADPLKVLTEPGLKKARQLILKNCIATMEDANADIRCMSKKLMQILKTTCNESFCSALVQDISWNELKVAEKNLNVDGLTAVLKKQIK